MAYTRVPVAFIPAAQDGSGLASIQAGGLQWTIPTSHVDRTALYGAMVYRAIQAGGVKAVLWHQGETDAINAITTNTYKTTMATLAAAIKTDLNCPLIPCKLQVCTGITQANVNAINAAIGSEWTTDANILPGPDLSDQTSIDAYHLKNDNQQQVAAGRWWLALYQDFYAPAQINSVSRRFIH